MGSIAALHSTVLWPSPKKWWWIFTHRSWHLNDSMPWNLAAGSYIFWERGSSRRVIYPKTFCRNIFFFSLSISQHHWTSTCLQQCPGRDKVVQRNVSHGPVQQAQRLSGRVGWCTVKVQWEKQSQVLGIGDLMAPHSSTLAWKIPWTEEPGRLQSMGSLRVGHDWTTSLSLFTFMHWRRKWQPILVLLPGESQGRWSLVSCQLWGRTESDTTEAT